MLHISSNPDDIILDFFAGSGTTAEAVMRINSEDNGNRKFIIVQLPEKISPKSNKTAYDFVQKELKVETPTIFEITKERLIRASKKIQEVNKDKDLSNQDLGFKIFETMPIWEDYNFEADELDARHHPRGDAGGAHRQRGAGSVRRADARRGHKRHNVPRNSCTAS